MKKYVRTVGIVLAASGLALSVVAIFRSYAEEPGPWGGIGGSLVVLSLVCLVLGIRSKRDA